VEPALDGSALASNTASTAARPRTAAGPTHPAGSAPVAPLETATPTAAAVPSVAMAALLVQAASAAAPPSAAPVAVVAPAPLAAPVAAPPVAPPVAPTAAEPIELLVPSEPAEPQRGLDDLYDIGRLAARLGVEHATIRVWLSRKVPWLPAPDGRLNGGAVWRATTLAGIEERRTPGRPGRKRQTIAPPDGPPA
jgi:hypothetical protein